MWTLGRPSHCWPAHSSTHSGSNCCRPRPYDSRSRADPKRPFVLHFVLVDLHTLLRCPPSVRSPPRDSPTYYALCHSRNTLPDLEGKGGKSDLIGRFDKIKKIMQYRVKLTKLFKSLQNLVLYLKTSRS